LRREPAYHQNQQTPYGSKEKRDVTKASGGFGARHPQIVVLGYSPAFMFLQQPDGMDVTAMIAIGGLQEYCIEARVPHRLELVFDDIDIPDPNDMFQMHQAHARQAFDALNGRVKTPPALDHARAIIEFAERVRDVGGILLCHCGAGISRSPAAALLCLATWLGPGKESECVDELFRVRPVCDPHRDLVRFGDQLLNREGKLIEALSRAVKQRTDSV
jgi:predicted protein tyrosine phosphatase